MSERYDIVILGLSITSSWGNGHATTYRALLKALARRGHDVLFLERDVPWYRSHRDIAEPDYCRLELYGLLEELQHWRNDVREADAVQHIATSRLVSSCQSSTQVMLSSSGRSLFQGCRRRKQGVAGSPRTNGSAWS